MVVGLTVSDCVPSFDTVGPSLSTHYLVLVHLLKERERRRRRGREGEGEGEKEKELP